MATLRPAADIVCGAVAGVLAADVWLVRTGREPATAALQTVPGRVFLGVLVGHVWGILGPLDPFLLVGKVATWSAPRGRILP